jgi:hypothetical protein
MAPLLHKFVMLGQKREARLQANVPGIHVLDVRAKGTWMAGP